MTKTNPKPAKKESEPVAPADLRKVLAADPRAKAQWSDLTSIGRRDFIRWIASAKLPETRKRRLESVPGRLASGKRRPCCYAVVPMTLYRALGANEKAKAQWSDLTPDERRDFVDWVDSAKESVTHKRRVEQACSRLAAGKRHP